MPLILTITFACFSTAYAQRVGGYKPIAATDPAAKEAADFAVDAQMEKSGKKIELVKLNKAERQIVQGTNYKLCLKVKSEGAEGEADVTHFVEAIVYVDLKRNYSLRSWKPTDCDEEDED